MRWLALILLLVCSTATASLHTGKATLYRNELTREARAVWGLRAPIATLAAQIHQESNWEPNAKSHVGARGLAQFMPATASWIVEEFPELGGVAPTNPSWALRAQVRYMKWLHERVDAINACERMAMALSSYNGGLGNLNKEIAEAKRRSMIDPQRWFGHVEAVSRRADWAFKENRGYVARILLVLEDRYSTWGSRSC